MLERPSVFVAAESVVAAFAGAPRIARKRFRQDLDKAMNQDPAPAWLMRRHARGLIDTSVVIDLEVIAVERLPRELAVSAITMAELAAGPHATTDASERARRQRSTPTRRGHL